MNKKLFTLLLALMLILTLFTGCSTPAPTAQAPTPQATEPAADTTVAPAEPAPEPASQTTEPAAAQTTLTQADAEAIALEHAGLTADQVSFLHSEYEIDDRIPQYDVEFYYDNWEYNYEINADTGDILSFERDD